MYDGAERLGDPDRRRRRRPGPPRRPRGGGPLRPDRAPGRAALLRPRRGRAAARAGSRWSGTRCSRSARKVLASRMVRDYVNTLYTPGGAVGACARRPGARGRAGAGAAGSTHVAKEWGAVHVDHLEAGGVGDSPDARREPPAARVRLARRRSRPTTSTARCCSAGPTTTTGWSSRPRCRWLLRCRTRAAGGASTGVLPLDRAGSFGYTVRILPKNRYLASAAEMNLVALPRLARRHDRGRPALQTTLSSSTR